MSKNATKLGFSEAR